MLFKELELFKAFNKNLINNKIKKTQVFNFFNKSFINIINNNKLKFVHFNLLIYLLKILPYHLGYKIILNLKLKVLNIYINNINLIFLLNFLKKHNKLSFKTLIAITVVDYIKDKNRFELNYFLLSYKLNCRINIKILINDHIPVLSIFSVYNASSWYEREVWDLFGIFFLGNNDLRRILTDYGFEGHPFRKDFPQTGFMEVRYDDELKLVKYEFLELVQEHRFFDFNNSWMNI
jgi:NADH/F420H2 dehydrogenase subunit C